MKTIVTSEMVAHLWANQSQQEARNAGRNRRASFYFEGDTIYSYGGHFPIAKHVEHKGEKAILFTTRHYSPSTSGHCNMVLNALRHKQSDIIRCYNPAAIGEHDHKSNLKEMRERCEETLNKALRSRTQTDWLRHETATIANEHARYRALFGKSLDKPLTISEDWQAQAKAQIAKNREAIKNAEKIKEREKKKLIKSTLEVLSYWKLGEDAILEKYPDPMNRPRYDTMLAPIALRLSSKGEVETSRGARIPADHARRIWKMVKGFRASGQSYQRNGHTIHAGQFAVDSIDAHGTLTAGCHTIEFAAMVELAERLGWK